MPRAFLRIGGLTVARQQLALTLELQCERVICLAPQLAPEVVELQHIVEAAGAQFHVVSHARALVGLVTAVDEVIVIGEGLFVSIPEAAALLEEGQAVLVQPIEQGLAAGFERIDLNHAAAGAMRVPGRLVERLAELPSDVDAASALQRIALQAGVRQKLIPTPGQDGLFWTLVRSEDEAQALEPAWIRHRTGGDLGFAPSRTLALLGVRSFGPALIHAGTGRKGLLIAAAVLAALAFGAGWFQFVPLALIFVALAWVIHEAALLQTRIENAGLQPTAAQSGKATGWIADALIVLLFCWTTPPEVGATGIVSRAFAPFMLVASLRMLQRLVSPRWASLLGDRGSLALALCVAVAAGVGSIAVQLAAALAVLAGILVPSGQNRLTQP